MRGCAGAVRGEMFVSVGGRVSSLFGNRVGEIYGLIVVSALHHTDRKKVDLRPIKPSHLGQAVYHLPRARPLQARRVVLGPLVQVC